MPEQITRQDRPELGFVSVGQYLNANRGQLNKDYEDASQQVNSFSQAFDPLYAEAFQKGAGVKSGPGDTTGLQDTAGYRSALDKAQEAQNLRVQLGSTGGLASRMPGGALGEGNRFSSALQWANAGPGYKQLSDYLGNYTPENVSARMQEAAQRGVASRGPQEAAPAPPEPSPPEPKAPELPPWHPSRYDPWSPPPDTRSDEEREAERRRRQEGNF